MIGPWIVVLKKKKRSPSKRKRYFKLVVKYLLCLLLFSIATCFIRKDINSILNLISAIKFH